MNSNYFVILVTCFLFLAGCSGSERFTSENKKQPDKQINSIPIKEYAGSILNPVRVLLQNKSNDLSYIALNSLHLFDSKNKIALVNKGNELKFISRGNKLSLNISGKSFESDFFEIQPADSTQLIIYEQKSYRGKIRFVYTEEEIKVINIINLEDYIKGVIPSEMPVGKGELNLEALKAFAICARTYSLMKMNMNKTDFDLYLDVRDQVYGGADTEKQLSNRAVDETAGQVLYYNGKPATTFYHSTCGGWTENSKNVFTKEELPYLSGVEDKNPPYCSISPRFNWKETFTRKEFINRLIASGLVKSNSELENVEIKSRFDSGRVNELEITVIENEEEQQRVSIYGNNIRSVIRTADNKSILFSSMFDISIKGNDVLIEGKGYGHGVGMCQYGAIGMCHSGKNFLEILLHYFPGTGIKNIYE